MRSFIVLYTLVCGGLLPRPLFVLLSGDLELNHSAVSLLISKYQNVVVGMNPQICCFIFNGRCWFSEVHFELSTSYSTTRGEI